MAQGEPNVQINYGSGPGPSDVALEDVTHEEHILPYQGQFVSPINYSGPAAEPFYSDTPNADKMTPVHQVDDTREPFVDEVPVPNTNPVGEVGPGAGADAVSNPVVDGDHAELPPVNPEPTVPEPVVPLGPVPPVVPGQGDPNEVPQG